MKYRAEIDGLRALAVLPVMLFHAGFELFSGGFVGVDIFFVISGYLITTILIEDIEKNRFSLVAFYERRARRILPALFFVMFLCIPFAWVWMHPTQMQGFSQSIVGVNLFLSNVLFWLDSGYFAAAAEEKPLLHTWSLAVEEQYYLIFPVFIFLAFRYGKNATFWSIVVLAVISLALSEWGWRNRPSANFYLAPTRAWELLAGSIVAFIITKHGVKSNNLLSLSGLALVLSAIFFYDETTPFPSIYALIPVIGVVLVILFAGTKTLAAKLFSTRAFVGVGLISYSAYLWHQPLLAFARIRSLDQPSLILMSSLVVVSILVGWFSWKFVETPFRDKEKFGKKKIWSLATFSSVVLITFGLVGHETSGYESRYSDKLSSIFENAKKRNPYSQICHLPGGGSLAHPIKGCTDFFVDNAASVMMIGDSHLESIGNQIQRQLKDLGIGSYNVSSGSCVSLKGLYLVGASSGNDCHKYNQAMLEYAREIGVETVILISRFTLYAQGSRYDNGEGGVESGLPSFVDLVERRPFKSDWDDLERRQRVLDRYNDELKGLLQDFKVVVFEPIPEVGWDTVSRFAKLVVLGEADIKITHSLESYLTRSSNFLSILDQLPQENLLRFSVADVLCDKTDGRCAASDDKGLYYRDDNHLSLYGANVVADKFVPNLLNFISK